jgi:2-methylisocitrate lyase-like PEP mutase family enzyme
MSKFRTRIRDIGRAPGGMGFTAIARRERPRYVIVVAEAANPAEAKQAAEAGADAVVLTSGSAAGLGLSIPVGVRIPDATRAEVEAAREAGADFFLFDDGSTHAGALTVESMGAVLLLGADQDEQRLRAVAAIDLDAVLVEADADTITVREQIELRRVASLIGAPILLRALGQPDTANLEAWRDAGAPAVLVPAAQVEATMAAAREVPAPRRTDERRLPVLGGLVTEADDGDEDDEHEHDH